METEKLIRKWAKILGLQRWKISLRPDADPPSPSKNSAQAEYDFPSREAAFWVKTEPEVIHEEVHLLLSGLEHLFWQLNPDRARRALWTRREERVVERLEAAFLRVLNRKGL